MRKKTALRTPQQRETSVREPGGLIDRGENAQDSATAKSALTNRSHRTHSIRSHRMRETDLPCKIIPRGGPGRGIILRSEEHTSELQSLAYLVCRLLLEKKKKTETTVIISR